MNGNAMNFVVLLPSLDPLVPQNICHQNKTRAPHTVGDLFALDGEGCQATRVPLARCGTALLAGCRDV